MNSEKWHSFIERYLEMYPKSRLRDIYKLIFQACFGPGHILTDEQGARQYLENEYQNTSANETIPLVEIIDPHGTMARLNLARARSQGIDTDTIFLAFSRTADELHECDDFLKIWSIARKFMTEDDELGKLDDASQQVPIPAVHHSNEYRIAYSPAYRVVRADIIDGLIVKDD